MYTKNARRGRKEGGNNFAPCRGPISDRASVKLKYLVTLFCHGGTGPGAGNAGDGPGCLFGHTQSFIWATKCPFRVTSTSQGSSLGHISCPETAHHMKAS
jgi:hypothetical protein